MDWLLEDVQSLSHAYPHALMSRNNGPFTTDQWKQQRQNQQQRRPINCGRFQEPERLPVSDVTDFIEPLSSWWRRCCTGEALSNGGVYPGRSATRQHSIRRALTVAERADRRIK